MPTLPMLDALNKTIGRPSHATEGVFVGGGGGGWHLPLFPTWNLQQSSGTEIALSAAVNTSIYINS